MKNDNTFVWGCIGYIIIVAVWCALAVYGGYLLGKEW